jgi:CDP-6-deoxy-D-xylo-4-hexulose-3-dehydrase
MNAHLILKDYDYPVAFSGWGAEEKSAIDRVCASGKFTIGHEVEAFESELAAFHGMDYAVAVNSGSSANLISVAAMSEMGMIDRGDNVLVPALAWSTTFSPLIQYGLNPILLDADSTWNAARDSDLMYSHSMSGSDSNKVRLVVDCSILGNPSYGGFWAQVASNLGAKMLSDTCESIGARDPDGVMCGTRAIANTFSFYYSHQMSAVEGGAILTNDGEFARICKLLRSHGWTRGLRMIQCVEDEYRFEAFGYNVRPLELHCAIAREQLKKLPQRIYERRRNYAHWMDAVNGLPVTLPELRGSPSPFCLHFCVRDSETRQSLANALRANGIDCRPPIAGSFGRQPYGKRWSSQRTPVADEIHRRGMAIGNAPFPIPHLIDMAVKVMRETL